jgi:2-iminobutanoate/2-iminopropanoate deaminase
MKKQVVNIPGIKPPGSPFSYVVRAGDFLFLSSQLSVDIETGKILGGNITEQTKRALENVKFLLGSCGANMVDIVKVAIYIREIDDFNEMDQVYREYFTEGQEPARVTMQARSPIEGINIEIEVTALLPS